jgi:hypothetical protein
MRDNANQRSGPHNFSVLTVHNSIPAENAALHGNVDGSKSTIIALPLSKKVVSIRILNL